MPVYFRKLLRYCTAVLCVLTAASGTFLFLALRTEYDIALRHFVQDASLPLIPAILCILGCALTAVPAITAAAKKTEGFPAQNASAALNVMDQRVFSYCRTKRMPTPAFLPTEKQRVDVGKMAVS